MPPHVPDVLVEVLARDLTNDLAPLNTIYNDFAEYSVKVVWDDALKDVVLEVHAPERVRALVPRTYYSFPVRFMPRETNSDILELSVTIDVSQFKHGIYA